MMKDSQKGSSPAWFKRLGPGIVTACVVIGPGSILSSTKVGATHGFSTVWVVALGCFLMLTYVTLGARLGVITGESAASILSRKTKRWFATMVCLGLALISVAYQFGNNLAVHAAFNAYRPDGADSGFLGFLFDWGIVIFFNTLALLFIFGFKDLYRVLERIMMGFVGLMLLAFLINLVFASPDLIAFAKGFVPSATNDRGESLISLELVALLGTTFVLSAAFYQSYLVRFRGWKKDDLPSGMVDARVGALIMMVLTLMIVATAASVFYGDLSVDQVMSMNASDVANQLRPAFGEKGKLIFCIGLFSAAYSSFIVNSMIGGFILSDGLGLGDTPNHKATRICTALVLIFGMVVSLAVTNLGWNPVSAIVAAQAATVIFAPLAAVLLWWMTASKDVMGESRNSLALNVAAAIGIIALLFMAFRLAIFEIPKRLKSVEPPKKAAALLPYSDPDIAFREGGQ
jgi:NRAMP (natural resistance-associated macrophage protein)-like metal ion transporter